MNTDYNKYFEQFKGLFSEVQARVNDDYWNPENWNFRVRDGLPKQAALSNDCGVFTILWTVMEAFGLDLNQVPHNKPLDGLRCRFAYAWLKGKALSASYEYNLGEAGFTCEDRSN